MKKKVVQENGIFKVLVWDKNKNIGGGQATTEKEAYDMAVYNYRAQRRPAPMTFRAMLLWAVLGAAFIFVAVAYVAFLKP